MSADLDQIRSRHESNGLVCKLDGLSWPCDAFALVGEVERIIGMNRNLRDAHEALKKVRANRVEALKQLVAELERRETKNLEFIATDAIKSAIELIAASPAATQYAIDLSMAGALSVDDVVKLVAASAAAEAMRRRAYYVQLRADSESLAYLRIRVGAVLDYLDHSTRPCEYTTTGICTHGEGGVDPQHIRGLLTADETPTPIRRDPGPIDWDNVEITVVEPIPLYAPTALIDQDNISQDLNIGIEGVKRETERRWRAPGGCEDGD